jgi:hypothetical protein|tara:strand:+ start:78 stop:515 length:438 start_codon:yes stop_codon:yes gene_type:complete
MRKWRQGIFTPSNQHKFIGSKAVYRSGLELKFFRFCDNNPNVKKWGSENVVVPYISPLDKRAHRYYVDNYIEILEGKYLKKYLVEIKPSKQTKPPTTKYRKRRHLLYEQRAYVVNQAKWEAARNYSKKNGCEFIILTEKELILNK